MCSGRSNTFSLSLLCQLLLLSGKLGFLLDATTSEQEFDLATLHTLASVTLGDDPSATAAHPDAETTMPAHSTRTMRRRLRKPITSSVSTHVSETIPTGVRVLAAASTIPATSSVDAVVRAAATPSPSIPTTANKGKAPMVYDSIPADLLSEQECVLKNLYDSQLGEELAKKIYRPSRKPSLPDSRRSWHRRLLLGDDVTKENINERLGMLLMRKRRELAEQRSTFHPKPTLDAPHAKRATQGDPPVPTVSSPNPAGVPAAPSILVDVSLPAAT
nr:hypothetical protein [Tanacetum cinerariifolium]